MAAPWIEWKIRFDADHSFRRYLRSLEAGLKTWAKTNGSGDAALRRIQDYHKGLFDSGGAGGLGRASGTGSWAALRRRTIRARLFRVRCSRIAPRDYAGPAVGGGILFWSGRLRGSLTGERFPGSNISDQIRRVGARGLTFGTKCPTAVFHRAGRASYNPMPKRNPLDDVVGPDVGIDAIEERLLAFLTAE